MKIFQEIFCELRKLNEMTQKAVGDKLGVTYQTVSKWENGLSMPDVSLLPEISKMFEISIDQLLGVKPLSFDHYQPRNKDSKFYREKNTRKHEAARDFFWNDDYFAFLVKDVWKINKPVRFIEYPTGTGTMIKRVLDTLPSGSKYIGIDDSDILLDLAKEKYKDHPDVSFYSSDDVHRLRKSGDIVFTQGYLRHCKNPVNVIDTLKALCKHQGMIIANEVNRPFEVFGYYVDDDSYEEHHEMLKLLKRIWDKELEVEGRDYKMGMKAPYLLKNAGIENISTRMNDHMKWLSPKDDLFESLLTFTGRDDDHQNTTVNMLMDRGLNHHESVRLEELLRHRYQCLKTLGEDDHVLFSFGLVISWGYLR